MTTRLVLTCLVTLAILGVDTDAGTISDTASGSPTPTPSYSAPLANGDFTIDTLHSFPIGDGEDDWTTWEFDFTGDPDYPLVGPLTSAVLTLTLTPVGPNVSSDMLQVGSLSLVGPSEIRSLVPGSGIHTVSLDLLDHYTDAELRGELTAGSGRLAMLYHDDSIVSFAGLELATVPLPTPLFMGLGLLVLLGAGRRIRRRR